MNTGPRAIDHDPGIAELHLRAFHPPTIFAVMVMLTEAECFREPIHRIGNVLIGEARQYDVRRHGTVFQHDPPYNIGITSCPAKLGSPGEKKKSPWTQSILKNLKTRLLEAGGPPGRPARAGVHD